MKLLREFVSTDRRGGGLYRWRNSDSDHRRQSDRNLRLLFGSAFSWPDGIGYTLFYATPLIFTGLAVLVAFRCGLLNIGAEGQLYIAAFATAWVGITFANHSAWLLDAAVFHGRDCWRRRLGRDSRILKARFGSHEVINTIMLNFLAVALVSYFTQYHYKVPGDPIMQTLPIGPGAHIARLGKFIPGIAATHSAESGFYSGADLLRLVYVFLWRTKWGYEIARDGNESQPRLNTAASRFANRSLLR